MTDPGIAAREQYLRALRDVPPRPPELNLYEYLGFLFIRARALVAALQDETRLAEESRA